jgi:hypothetical protein
MLRDYLSFRNFFSVEYKNRKGTAKIRKNLKALQPFFRTIHQSFAKSEAPLI